MPSSPVDRAPLLAVDVGNSSVRIGLFRVPRVDASTHPDQVVEFSDLDDRFATLSTWLPPEDLCWVVSSVNRPTEQRLAQWRKAHRGRDAYRFLTHTDVPLSMDVDRPSVVGMDRLAAATAANVVRDPDRPVIVIDAGSAITVDAVSKTGTFLGGVIMPGLSMAASALHCRTDQLPDVESGGSVLKFQSERDPATNRGQRPSRDDGPPPVVGKSTDEAIRSGLVWGTVGALKYFIEQMTREFEQKPDVLFAGGDASLLAPLVQQPCTTCPDLVLLGIALIHNQSCAK